VKNELVALARSLGFSDARIATADNPRHAAEFRQWLADGCHGGMEWLARNADRRTQPDLVQPGARSVIALSLPYFQGGPPSAIARYAWGDDYHELIEQKLRALDEWLRARGGTQRCYVDTGPVLERDFAADAGIGWHGKSTMLLNRTGTWFFLAEILTTLEFPPDEPATNHCGSCTRCITACPTGAITAPHHLDARLCISYLTIEHHGPIPEALRPLFGGRIYGCDACLEACPWNRFAATSSEMAFAARDYVHDWKLRDFLALDDEAFRTLFRKSPIKRIKRARFLRNVCVALGNVGTPDDLPALLNAVQDADPLIAEHARWAIREIAKKNSLSEPS